MGSYCTKLWKAGCEYVAVNGGKRSKSNPARESSSKNVKWPRRGEANYLLNLPEGHDETSLENARNVLVEEMKRKRPNGTLISQMMDHSSPLRRRETVKNEPPVQNMVERWPALCTERQDTTRDEAFASVTVGVLMVLSEDDPRQDTNSTHLQSISTAIVLEGGIVMDNIKDFPQAVCRLFGLTYFTFGLPKMHGKYTQVHGNQSSPSKTAQSEKQSTELDQ